MWAECSRVLWLEGQALSSGGHGFNLAPTLQKALTSLNLNFLIFKMREYNTYLTGL